VIPPRTLLLATLGIGAGLALAVWFGTGREPVELARGPVALAPEAAGADATLVPDELRTEPRSEPSAGASTAELPAPRTARAFLADYYGASWPEIEARIVASGQADLELPYTFLPWEDVELVFERSIPLDTQERADIVRGQLRWPETLSPEFLAEQFQLEGRPAAVDEAELQDIETLVAAKNQALAELGEFFADRIDFYAQEKWQRGDYLRRPFTTAGLSDVQGFHSQSHGGFGWAVTLTLRREDCPDVVQLEREIQALCRERDGLVLEYLAARSGR